MKRLLQLSYLLIFLLVLLYGSLPLGQTPGRSGTNVLPHPGRVDLTEGQKYVPGEVLVRFRQGIGRRMMLASHARVGGVIKREFRSVPGLQHIQLPPNVSVKKALHAYRQDPNVLYAEPNYIVHPLTLPNDPAFGQQWGLSNNGQYGGTSGSDIHAQQAWDVSTGSSNVVVAVIDTGIDYNHPDLAQNIWSAPTGFTQALWSYTVNCPAGSHGYAPNPGTTNGCDPMDLVGHGTHVAGIIGAVGNNALGVAGVNWNVQLMACNFAQDFSVEGAVDCLDFVKMEKDAGVNIIATNNSWGGSGLYSQALIDAITAQEQDGILFIAAAGNSFQDNDLFPTEPASLFLPNIISVAATDRNDNLPTFSNFGRHSVHLGAPGQEIFSTLPGDFYGYETGTSMSAPFVTGVAALLAAADPTRDWRAIRNLLLAGGDTVPSLANTVTGKRLNAYGALTCSDSPVAGRLQPSALNTTASVGSPVTLSYLNINCAKPNGPVEVQVSPGGATVTLNDDGTDGDQAAGDGIYSAQWTPSALGTYQLAFPNGDNSYVQVLSNYVGTPVQPADYSYRAISGTNLNLGDDSVATITSPFPIQFGGGSFSNLYVSSNGTISLTDAFGAYVNDYLPNNYHPYDDITTLLAPFWEDLYPVAGTNNNVFWAVTGSAPNRELVVEWRDVESYACHGDNSATVKFQVVFTEGSPNVLFNYADSAFGGNCADEDYGGRATVGIQVAPTQANMWGSDEPDLGNGTGILWTLASSLPNYPVPTLTSISPTSVSAGGPDMLVTLNGTNFVPQSRVELNGWYGVSTYVSSTQLQVVVPASLTQNPGGVGIVVYNPAPAGGRSSLLSLTVNGQTPPPAITGLNPPSIAAGSFSFALEVDGSRFDTVSTVNWNGTPLLTYYYSTTKLGAVVVNNTVTTPGTVQITVTNGSQGGTSNSVPFTITTAAPQLSGTGVAHVQSQGNAATRTPTSTTTAVVAPQYLPRFIGWNALSREGPAYVKRFLRPHAPATVPMSATNLMDSGGGLRPIPLSGSLSGSSLPGFQMRPSLTTDYIPTSVATGDFNGDGHMDWVVANGGVNTLWVYLGKGDGTAQPPLILPLKGSSPVAVAAVDLRGSGILDLVVAEADSGTVGVLLGNGDGSFGPETEYFVPGAALCMLVDDFNGDGHKDILVGMAADSQFGELAFLPGNGTGAFGPPVYRPFPNSMTCPAMAENMAETDLNGDGLPDLVVNEIASFGNAVYTWINQGDGTFKQGEMVDMFEPGGVERDVINLALDDVNGDGCVDMVDIDTWSVATVFLGNCDGTFQSRTNASKFGIGDISAGLTLADVNGDGKLDIVASAIVLFNFREFGDQPGNVLSVLLGDGHGNFSNARTYEGQPSAYSLAVADLNGDGHPDVLTASQDADALSIFLNDGSGGFGFPGGEYVGYQGPWAGAGTYSGFKIADINGDGKADMTSLEYGPGYPDPFQLTVMLNQGGGDLADPVRSAVIDGAYTTNGFPGDFAFGDFRNTGRPDFVAVGSFMPYLAFAKNNGDGTFTPLPLAKPAGAQGILGVGDFNADGKLDIVALGIAQGSNPNSSKSTLTAFLGNGDGTFSPGASLSFNDVPGTYAPASVWVGDFNRDGKPDILVRLWSSLEGTAGDDVFEFLGKGDGTFNPGTVVLPNSGDMAVGDVNNDGLPDIVEYVEPLSVEPAGLPLQYAIYLGQPDGSFKLSNTLNPYGGLLEYPLNFSPGVVLGDFNGDGKLDIASFQFLPGFRPTAPQGPLTYAYAQVLLGNGDGTFSPTYTTVNFNGFLVPTFFGDLTGDGKTDMIQLAGYSSSFHILPAAAGPALQIGILSTPIIGSNGTVQVTLPLPSTSDTVVQLAASDPAVSIAPTVTIPANSVSQNVPFSLGSSFNPQHVFAISATLGTQTAVAYGWQPTGSLPMGFRLALMNPSQMTLPSQSTPDYGLGVYSINGYATTAQLSCIGLPAWATCQFDLPSLSVQAGDYASPPMTVATTGAAVPGTYPFTVVVSDQNFTQQIGAVFKVGDFGVSLAPSTVSAPSTGSATFTVAVTSVNSYSGDTEMSLSGLPDGATGPAPPWYIGAGSPPSSFTIQLSDVAPGNYPITLTGISYPYTLTGSNPGVVRSATATLVVQPTPDFTGSVAPGSATASTTQAANFTITLNSINGATGAVNLQCSDLPEDATCAFSPASPTLTANASVSDTLTVRAGSATPSGTYPFTVVATNSSVTHNLSATLVVQQPPGFTGGISPSFASLSVGQSANFNITLNSHNGATGAVSLQCLNLPSGSTCTFNPASPTLPANGTVTDQLTVQVNSRPAAAPAARGLRLPPRGGVRMFWLYTVVAAFLLLAGEFRRRNLHRGASAAALLCAALLFIVTASCGGGGGSSPSLGPTPSQTVFTVTVQASGAGTSSTQTIGTVTITVN